MRRFVLKNHLWRCPGSPVLLEHTCDRFKSRFAEAVRVISGDFGRPPNGALSLKRSEATSLTEWEECVIVASSTLPQLRRCAFS